MKNRKVHFQDCEFIGKRVSIDFDEEILDNGNGRDRVFETPVKCSIEKCPNIKNCIYMKEKSHWK